MSNGCPFCDRSQFEERIVAETDSFYVVATFGQITNGGYVLIVPKEHVSCMAEISVSLMSQLLDLQRKVCKALTFEYSLYQPKPYIWPVTMFEHGIVGQTVQHAHLHILPIALDLTLRIRRDFPANWTKQLTFATELRYIYQKMQSPYLYWSAGLLEDTESYVCWDPPAPPMYLRTVAANMVGRSERADWRTMNSKLDRKLWSSTVHRLKLYF
jgi:diadenosine tetraphosphate (Ap4A) HIT family hydrolase